MKHLNSLTKDNFSRLNLLEAHNSLFNYDIISLCETTKLPKDNSLNLLEAHNSLFNYDIILPLTEAHNSLFNYDIISLCETTKLPY